MSSKDSHSLASLVVKSVAVIGIAATAGLVVAPLASAATPRPTSHTRTIKLPVRTGHRVGDESAYTFNLENFTPFRVHLVSATTKSGWEQDPDGHPSQQTVEPGYTSNWSVDGGWVQENQFDVSYGFTDQTGALETVAMSLTDGAQDVACTITGANSGDWQCDVDEDMSNGQTYFVLHASAAAMNLSGAAKDQFAQALDDVCTDGSGAATCSFAPGSTPATFATSPTPIPLPGAVSVPGCFASGNQPEDYSQMVDTSQTMSTGGSDTIGVSTNLFDIADVAFQHETTWGKSFTNGKGYTVETHTVPNYGYSAMPVFHPTIGSGTGTFTATLHGTTYTFGDVTIRTSGAEGTNADGSIYGTGVVSAEQTAMTLAQFHIYCQGDVPPAWMTK